MGFKIWCQVGGGVTPFSKLPYSREFLNMSFKSCLFSFLFLFEFIVFFFENFKNVLPTYTKYKRSLWTIFWKLKKPFSIWVLVGSFNLRLGTYNVPPGSSAPSLTTSAKREFDGTGWTGGTGYQKCPLNFFELCGHLELVYIYLYTK